MTDATNEKTINFIMPNELPTRDFVDNFCTTDKEGYLLFYMPEHPLARQNGTVVLARHIMSVVTGRWIEDDELVTYKDKHRDHVSPDNLELIDRVKLGQMRDLRIEYFCPCGCGHIVSRNPSQLARRENTYFSPECSQRMRRLFSPEREELNKMVWEISTVKVAEYYGVSDKAINKRCTLLGIEKPPRGAWAKMYTYQARHGINRNPTLEEWNIVLNR